VSARRVLYRPDQVRRLVAGMREDLRDLRFKHLREMADLRRELDEVRNDYIRLREPCGLVTALRPNSLICVASGISSRHGPASAIQLRNCNSYGQELTSKRWQGDGASASSPRSRCTPSGQKSAALFRHGRTARKGNPAAVVG